MRLCFIVLLLSFASIRFAFSLTPQVQVCPFMRQQFAIEVSSPPVGLMSVQVLSLFISLTFLPRCIFFYPVHEDTKFSPKRLHLSTNLHGRTSHKAVICTVTTVRASYNTGVLCVSSPFYVIIIIIIIIIIVISCHRPFLPGTSLEPAVIPTAQASSFTLQYFPYYVWYSKYSCLLLFYYYYYYYLLQLSFHSLAVFTL